MANIIKPKRSNTAGLTPTTSNLTSGELGVNMADQKVYINNGTAVVQIGAGKLTGLSDVSVTTPSTNQVLQWNGTSWVNATASGSGTVTSVSALTLGTTGTDLSSTVATSTTTPVITLNVPTASATNRGALSSADWTTFNNKWSSGTALSATTGSFSGQVTSTLATGTAPFTIASTTLVTNLNVDMLDGQHGSYYQPASTAITTSNIGSQSVSSATTATTATTANALNTANNYQVNSLGVGTAGSGTAGEIRATNNVTAYYASDKKWKENVKPIINALEKVEYIGGKTFNWTQEYIDAHGGEDGYFVQREDFGVIAQDVRLAFPQAVRTREDGSLAVDYAKLSALAMQAIAELSIKVSNLEKKLKA